MGLAAYDIVGRNGEWQVDHDQVDHDEVQLEHLRDEGEAAFEAAVGAASLALPCGATDGTRKQ